MVIAKIIQNLANNIFFGKEAHMIVLNKFLEANIVNVTRFLSEVNVSQSASFAYMSERD
jgi:neurofibromin 1